MIARVDAAAYSVLLLDLLLRVQMIANPRKTRNSHLIDTPNQNQSYSMLFTNILPEAICCCLQTCNVYGE